MNPFSFLWRYRHLIFHTTRSDIKARYTGSMLGLAWALLNPMLLLSVYIILYAVIFQIRLPGVPSAFEYVLVIFAGLIPWFGFSEATSSSVTALVANPSLLHNTSFPAPVIPVKAVLASMVSQAIGLSILLLMLAATNHISLAWIFLPLAVGVQLLLSLGLGWILSVLNVFIRDLGQAIAAVLLFLMFISPIAYTSDFVSEGPLQLVLYLNPISYLINLYRLPLYYGRPPALPDLIVSVSLALGLFWLGYRFFMKIRQHLTDYV